MKRPGSRAEALTDTRTCLGNAGAAATAGRAGSGSGGGASWSAGGAEGEGGGCGREEGRGGGATDFATPDPVTPGGKGGFCDGLVLRGGGGGGLDTAARAGGGGGGVFESMRLLLAVEPRSLGRSIK